MSFELTFGRKLGIGFTVAALTLGLIAFVGYGSTTTLIENDKLVAHTRKLNRALAEVASLLATAESAQRGYAITGKDEYLEPYHEALRSLEPRLDTIRDLTAGNANQERRLEALRPLVAQKLDGMKERIELRRSQGADAALASVAGGEGRRLMDDIRALLDDMDQEAGRELDERTRDAETSAALAKDVMAWGSLIGILVIAVVGAFTTRSLTAQVGSAVRHIQSSSAELQVAANQQAAGAREQATAMKEVTTTISELLTTSRQIADSAHRVAQIAELTASAAQAGDATVERGREAIAGIRQQVDVIVAHMLDLGKKSQQIGAVLDIVSELAEQTNILAINATIEAAGAGDAGKRFAVVADEIRKLADRVAGSTKEIRSLIDEVRGAVNTTVMTTETGSKAVDSGSKQFAEMTSAFEQIASQVATTTEAAKEIGLSTKQQASAVEQVNVAISNVAQATKENEVSTAQTLQTAAELTGLSRDLLRIVQAQAEGPRATA